MRIAWAVSRNGCTLPFIIFLLPYIHRSHHSIADQDFYSKEALSVVFREHNLQDYFVCLRGIEKISAWR